MRMFMNGEIYLMKNPETIGESIEELTKTVRSPLQNEIFQLAINFFDMVSDENKDKVNYETCKEFWTAMFNEDGIEMTLRSHNPYGIPMVPEKRMLKNIEELDKKFISLRSFLDDATYVGKNCKSNIIILYEDKNISLWVMEDEENIPHYMISRKEEEIIAPKLYGEVHDEYRNKGDLYHAIFKQIIKDKDKSLW